MTDLPRYAEQIFLEMHAQCHFSTKSMDRDQFLRFKKRTILEIQDALENPIKGHGYATILVPVTVSKEKLEEYTKDPYLKMDWDFVRGRLETHLDNELKNIGRDILS